MNDMKCKYFNKFNTGMSDFVTPGKQLEYVAKCKPDEKAIIYIDKEDNVRDITWKELHIASNKLAWHLMKKGFGKGQVAMVSFPNGIEHILATLAVWKTGGCYMPVSCKITDTELGDICRIIKPTVSFTDKEMPCRTESIKIGSVFDVCKDESEEMPEDIAANPNMISPSGGTTGEPKFIKQNVASGLSDEIIKSWFEMSGMEFEQRQLLVGPLFHGAPHTAAFNGLFVGNTLIIPRNLRPESIVRYIKEYKIEFIQMIPTLMNRIIKLADVDKEDFKSIKALHHTGGYCSPYLKEKWIDIIGAEKVYEMYSMTEAIGITCIRGDEWLKHYGSVGLPLGGSRISIRDEEGNELGPHEVGEIHMTSPSACCMTEYINHKPLETKDGGFRSVGDFGYVDEDGYLYFSDRRSDMLVIGGENVFATEVETVLTAYEKVVDAVVVGIPDEEWGRRLHAIVQKKEEVSEEELIEYLGKHLLPYKVPKSFTFVPCIPRGDNGKVNRDMMLKGLIEKNLVNKVC